LVYAAQAARDQNKKRQSPFNLYLLVVVGILILAGQLEEEFRYQTATGGKIKQRRNKRQ
jgi:hypothetical protein